MSKLISAFTAQGSFDAELWYVTLFDEIPCKYALNVEDDKKCLDPNELTFDKCKHLFDADTLYRQYISEVEGGSDTEEIETTDQPSIELPIEEIEGELVFGGERGTSLYIMNKHRIFMVTWNKCIVYYSPNDNVEEIKGFIAKLWNCFPKYEPEEKLARVGLIKYSQGEYYTSFSDIKKTHINIEENYNDDFLPVYKDMIDFLNQRESGLILAWGSPGTGNYYIKIIWNFQSNCVLLCYANTTQLHRGTSS